MALQHLFTAGRNDELGDLRRKKASQPRHAFEFTDLLGHTLFQSLIPVGQLLGLFGDSLALLFEREVSTRPLRDHREQINRGNGERPLTEAAIAEKFRSNAARAVSTERATRVEQLVLALDDLAGARTLADGLALA